MDYVGIFDEIEKDDGTLLQLVYRSPTSSDDSFVCPKARLRDWPVDTFSFDSSPRNGPILSSTRTQQDDDHLVLPLFLGNNKEFSVNGGCYICEGSNFGTDYYLCAHCDKTFHKECVQSPPRIKHPYHPEHPLQLYFHYHFLNIGCLCCGRSARLMVYYCTICEVLMHPICAMKRIPFVIDPPKMHNHHPLTLFLRQTSLTCNVCGLLRKFYPTYICARCNFVAHNDCMHSPRIIKISRHHHRISYVSSFRYGEWSCGVCHKRTNGDYGAYACEKCSDYVVHSRCALGKDLWDGEDLEGLPIEDDRTQDVEPFYMICEGVIQYFLHEHHLRLEACILYDENKLCQACTLPIYEGYLYSCMECDSILHETCANAPRRIQHALHPHPLTLKASLFHFDIRHDCYAFECSACTRLCGGFVYKCPGLECSFELDVRCALVSEPFDYRGHKHPLFLALTPEVQPKCHLCEEECYIQLSCIECDFIVCIKCITLPYKVRYKHDSHFLTILSGGEIYERDWCANVVLRTQAQKCSESLHHFSYWMFSW